MKFKEMLNDPKLLLNIENKGFKEPSKIQEDSFQFIKDGHDLLARSETGSGKTLAFVLPLLEKLEYEVISPKILIVCPTRELVEQVAKEIRGIAKGIREIKVVTIYGGVSIGRQVASIKRGQNIVVATPGRLLDHIRRNTMKLNTIETLVLDEADEMLNMGFKDDIEKIINKTKKEKQLLLFSATLPFHIKKLAKKYMKNPKQLEIGKENKSLDNIEQKYVYIKKEKKKDFLISFLKNNKDSKFLIFSNTRLMSEKLSKEINKNNIKNVCIHGEIKQFMRKKMMDQIKNNSAKIMVATDVAARGIDIDDIDYVVNYDVSDNSESYLHRIGRTARAGKKGSAINIVTNPKEKSLLNRHIKFSNSTIKELKFNN